jgi:hypothetical protein
LDPDNDRREFAREQGCMRHARSVFAVVRYDLPNYLFDLESSNKTIGVDIVEVCIHVVGSEPVFNDIPCK